MRKAWLLVVPALALVLAGLAVAVVPGWLRPRLEAAGTGLCPTCRLEIGQLGIRLFPPGLRAREVKFEQGDPRESALYVHAGSVIVPVRLASLGRGSPLRLGVVELDGVSVEVREGDRRAASKPGTAGESEGNGFEAEGIVFHRSTFTYRKDSPAGAAYLHLEPVEATGGAFGSSAAMREQPLLARARTRLEGSGDVDLVVAARYFVTPPWADVDLRLTGQKLAEVNGYFEPEEGVTLEGLLRDSRGVVQVRGRRAEGTVRARFEGLGLKFHANRHRGGFAALLDNLAVRVKVKGANVEDPLGEAVKSVVTARHERESVVSFVLRTLREAALRVAMK